MCIRDRDWGTLDDFWMYSGNIYMLDSAKNDIHKYLVAEEGYSEKRSYFGEGESPGLTSATAIAIDASLYIANSDKAQKFTSGVRSPFEVDVYKRQLWMSCLNSEKNLSQLSRRFWKRSKRGTETFNLLLLKIHARVAIMDTQKRSVSVK